MVFPIMLCIVIKYVVQRTVFLSLEASLIHGVSLQKDDEMKDLEEI